MAMMTVNNNDSDYRVPSRLRFKGNLYIYIHNGAVCIYVYIKRTCTRSDEEKKGSLRENRLYYVTCGQLSSGYHRGKAYTIRLLVSSIQGGWVVEKSSSFRYKRVPRVK